MIASRANRIGAKGWEQADRLKEELQRQFTTVFGNDENAEADTFNGTIPQALLLMNGDLISRAISKEKGSFLRESVDEMLQKAGKKRALDQKLLDGLLNDLYLSALSRYPTRKERTLAIRVVSDTMAKSRDREPIDAYTDAYQDIFWALLNSSEFVLNH
jgi:hypothetical protein